MKVAFVSQPLDYIAPNYQGSSIGIWTDRAIQGLMGRGAQFIIYAKKFTNQPAFEQHGSVQFRRFSIQVDEWMARPTKLFERMFNYPDRQMPWFATDLSFALYGWKIARDIRRLQPDIVHVHNYSQFVPIIKKLNPRVKVVLHMHCEWLTQLSPAMIAPRLESVDLVAGCSDFITQTIQNAFPQVADRCESIYNGVDDRHFTPPLPSSKPDKGRRLLFVGRVSPEKGIHTLLKAFQLVAETMPDLQLEIAGAPGDAPFEYIVLVSKDPQVNALKKFYHGFNRRGKYYTELQGLIPPQLANRIHFTGYVAHNDLVRHYQSADVLVNPSLSESFGMSLIEAMSCNMPVIASRVGGMKEIVIPEKTGLFVDPDDPQMLAQAIVKIFSDENRLLEMGRAGKQRVSECYTWDQVTQTLWQQYQQLTNR